VALLWAVQEAMLLFAMWGLVIPLLLVGFTIAHHSFAGQVCSMLAIVVSVMLVVPLMAPYAMYGLAGWMAVTGLVLTLSTVRRESRQVAAVVDEEQV
jgi:hypothetical protein